MVPLLLLLPSALAWDSDSGLRLPTPIPPEARTIAVPTDPDRPASLEAVIGRPAHGARIGRLGDHWMADVPVLVDGVPVFRGDTLVRGVGGSAGVVIERPIGPPTGAFVLEPADAIAALAQATGSHGGRGEARRVIAPGEPPRRAFDVSLDLPEAAWRALVDAENGALLALWSEHASLSGTVTASHHVRGVDGLPLAVSPLPGARVVGDSGEIFADDAGAWTLDTTLPITVTLAGEYATVVDRMGTDLAWVSSAEDAFLDGPDSDLSEVDAYVHVHEVRDWGLAFWPTNPWVTTPIELHVEQGFASCNALYLGWTLHFYRPVPDCWSPAQHADVVFHEWGHGLHFQGRVTGPFDLALSEGTSDVVAWRMTGDPVIARGLFKDGSGFRDLTEVKRYPEDYTLDDAHHSGWIIGGAIHDFAWIAGNELGEAGALEALDGWFARFLAAGPEVATAFTEALAADDDDGNLTNGTPHDCALAMAFGRHGYGPLADGWTVTASHAPPPVEPEAAFELRAELAADPDPCLPEAVGPAILVWTVDGEPQPDGVAAPDGAAVVAAMDGLPGGALVTYRFEGELFDQTPWASPEDGTWTLEIPKTEVTDPTTGPTGKSKTAAAAGCGCDGTGSGASWLALLLGVVALRRR